MNYLYHLIIYFCIFALVSQSLNIIIGYCGRLSMAHASFFAIGAYVYAICNVIGVVDFFFVFPILIFVSFFFSMLLSIPSWTFKGDFFVVLTIAVQFLLYNAIRNWATFGEPIGSLLNMTNGVVGISGINYPQVAGFQLTTLEQFTCFTIVIWATTSVLEFKVLSSRWGSLLRAMRDQELVLEGLGVDTRRLKIEAMALACAMAALAGALYVGYTGFISPVKGEIEDSFLYLAMVLIGGSGNLRGSLLGAVFFILLPEVLKTIDLNDALVADFRVLLFGLMLVIIARFLPKGFAGEYSIKS